MIRPKNVCFLLPLKKTKKKTRVGRSLLIVFIYLFIFIIFPDFTKIHNRCVVCTKYITKRGLLGIFTYNTECMSYCKGISKNESQSKQVFKQQYSFKYDGESGKTNKKMAANRKGCVW